MSRHSHWFARGFSLIEMTVVLAITGALGLAAWKLLPALRPAAEGNRTQLILSEARQAVEGYVLRAHRLPCPDTDGDGLENCTATSVVGSLPYRTLGLSSSQALRYGVYRNANLMTAQDADLAVVKDRLIPLLPPTGFSMEQNGLDFCWGLRNAAAAPSGLVAGSVPVAYAIAHSGADGVFNGANATATGFEAPGQPLSSAYDDQVVATGLSELSGRLACPARLGEVQGAARAAYSAYDIDRSAGMYQEFRTFAVPVREANVALAATNLALSILDVANATATGITSVALTGVTAGVGAGSIAAAALGIAASAAAMVAATASTVTAGLALDKAKKQKTAAEAFKAKTTILAVEAMTAALAADKRGISP